MFSKIKTPIKRKRWNLRGIMTAALLEHPSKFRSVGASHGAENQLENPPKKEKMHLYN